MRRAKLWLVAAVCALAGVAVVGVVIDLRGADGEAALYDAGQAALAAQRWEEAVTDFEAVMDLDPGYRDANEKLSEALYLGGSSYLEGGRFDEAITWLQQVVSVYGEAEEKLAQALEASVVYIPAGEFTMGSSSGDVDERPERQVYLDAFEIDKYEVTNVQYRRFLLATEREGPHRWSGRYVHLSSRRDPDWHGVAYPPGEGMYPAAGVRWPDARDYCAWAGKRLPTEAEWEKAARGAKGRTYPWGDDWDATPANTAESVREYPQPVGSYPSGANPYGALDMAGNVWEWVSDWYDREYYTYAPDANPPGPPPGTGERILRGGAWDSSPDQVRASYRNASHFFGPNFRVGFRCARSPASRLENVG